MNLKTSINEPHNFSELNNTSAKSSDEVFLSASISDFGFSGWINARFTLDSASKNKFDLMINFN